MKQIASQGGALFVLVFVFFGPFIWLRAQPALPWIDKDIGSPAADGSLTLLQNEMFVSGAGEIGGIRDEFHFVYQRVAGDVDVTVRVNALDAPDARARAGIMIRNGLGASARHAFISVSPDQGVAFERRQVSRESADRTQSGATGPHVGLRLERKGNHFLAYRSADGTSWTLAGRDVIEMRESAYVGFAVASGSPEHTALAVLTDPSIDVDGQLPEPWATRQIGHTPQPGGVLLTSGSFVVQGAGPGVGASTDGFRYVYQPVRGDVEIIAGIASLTGDNQAIAGVMIRAALDDTSEHATMTGTLLEGWQFQRRGVAGATSWQSAGPPAPAPGWVKLVREGHLFSAFYAPDGVNWTLVDSDRIVMPDDVLVGVIVASDGTSTLASASFTGVVVRAPGAHDDPPTLAVPSPADGEQFEGAPATLVFTPSADHAAHVSSYELALFRDTDPVGAPPVAKASLGKPVPVAEEISVDISALLGTLESGSYKAVVTAIGPGGSASSAPSASFAR